MHFEQLKPEDIDVSISALRGALNRTWCAFCETTSIHGLKYTRDKDTNNYIRFIWFVITLLMFLCAVAMVVTFYMEYRSKPTRMNVESDHAPISSLIFPPTTICPEAMFNLQKSINFLKTLIMPNSTSVAEVSEVLFYMYGFIYDVLVLEERNIDLLEEVLTLNNLTILDFVEKLSWDCKDLLFRCRFKDKIVPCNQLFYTSYTFRGHCCSFNLNQTTANFNSRNAHAGLRNGLSIILYYNDSLYSEKKVYSHGFKILIQEINVFPSAYSIVKFVPLEEEVFLSVRPTQTFCSQAVKDLSFENRLCVFPHEKKLKFFDSYVGSNCIINCRIKKMLKLCNCYTYFFHENRINGRICSYKDLPCLTKNYAAIIGRYKKTQCTCYRNCEEIIYGIGVSSAPLHFNTPTVDSFYDNIKKDYSVVHIYMNSQVYRRIRRDLLSNMVTLVSNLGSAFSLFMGMSMISAIEIIYYLSVILNKFYQEECRVREILLQEKQQCKEFVRLHKQLQENVIHNGKDVQENLKVEDI